MRFMSILCLALVLLSSSPGLSGAAENAADGRAAGQGAPAAPTAQPGSTEYITFNLSGPVEIQALLEYVQKVTGKNFLYDASTFQGRVTLMPAGKIPRTTSSRSSKRYSTSKATRWCPRPRGGSRFTR